MDTKLSIVIPLYNKEKYIGRCLQSVLAQDLSASAYEIIIIDDESTDASASIAQLYAEKNSNVVLFRQQNAGAGAARNKGLEIAKGDYVYFLDADDYVAHNVLGCIVELAELNQLEILGFETNYIHDGSLTESSTVNHQNHPVQVMDGMEFIAKRNFRNEAWWYIIKKSFLLDTGIKFPEGRFLQDSIFTACLLLKTQRITKVNFDIHRFVKVENSATTNRNPNHILKFIDDLIYAIGRFDILIKGLDSSNVNYRRVAKVLRGKQQSFVFTLFIKAFRCRLLKLQKLKKILSYLNKLGVYPINRKIGGIGNKKTKLIYDLTFIPFFNNKMLLFLGLKLNRLISSN